MTVAFDAASHGFAAGASGTTVTWTHVLGGSATAIAVFLYNFDPNATVVSVKVGSTFLTQFQTISNSLQLWGVASPPTGSQTVTITMSTTNAFISGGATSVTGSDPTTCFDSTNNASAFGATVSCNVTSAIGELVADAGFVDGDTLTPGVLQTLRWSETDFNQNCFGSTIAASAGTTTTTWTDVSTTNLSILSGSFKLPPAADSFGNNMKLMMM